MGIKELKSYPMTFLFRPALFALAIFAALVFFTPWASMAASGAMGLSKKTKNPLSSPEGPLLPCSFGSTSPLMPQYHQSGPAAGEFLVATRQLKDSVFSETVILLLEHGSDGAMGLIINRPSKVPIAKLFPEVKELEKRKDRAYIGGPVQLYKVFLLLDSESKTPPGKSLRIFDNVYISPDMQTLRSMALDHKAKFRIYAGYAGWASGQLEAEISRGDWYIVSADEKTIFDMPASEVWPDLIDRAGIEAMGRSPVPVPMKNSLSPAIKTMAWKTGFAKSYFASGPFTRFSFTLAPFTLVPFTLVHVSVLPKSGRST